MKVKMYSLIGVDNDENNKAKAVNKNFIKNIRNKEYIDVFFNKKVIRDKVKIMQSKLHRIGTYAVFKSSLSCFDDKRYILHNSISTLAYFHKDIFMYSRLI